MSSLNFPASPTLNQTYTFNNVTYTWNGIVWLNSTPIPASTLSGTTLPSSIVTSSLTAVGTITSGVWQGTGIGLSYGGTGGNGTATGSGANVLATSPTVSNLTISGSGVTFPDGTIQTSAGVPSITPTNTSNTTNSFTLSSSIVKDSMVIIGNGSTAVNVTIPADSTYLYPVGASITFQQGGQGLITFVAASGVNPIQATPGLKLRTQYSVATIQKIAGNTWMLYGDLSA